MKRFVSTYNTLNWTYAETHLYTMRMLFLSTWDLIHLSHSINCIFTHIYYWYIFFDCGIVHWDIKFHIIGYLYYTVLEEFCYLNIFHTVQCISLMRKSSNKNSSWIAYKHPPNFLLISGYMAKTKINKNIYIPYCKHICCESSKNKLFALYRQGYIYFRKNW